MGDDNLENSLAPLAPFLAREDVTDLYVNRPGELWIETRGGGERHALPGIDDAALGRLARQIASAADQGIDTLDFLTDAVRAWRTIVIAGRASLPPSR